MVPSFIKNNIISPIEKIINNFKENLYNKLNDDEQYNRFQIVGTDTNYNCFYNNNLNDIKFYIEFDGNMYIRKSTWTYNKEIDESTIEENSLKICTWQLIGKDAIEGDTVSIFMLGQWMLNENLYFTEHGYILLKIDEFSQEEQESLNFPIYEYDENYKVLTVIPLNIIYNKNNYCYPYMQYTTFKTYKGFKTIKENQYEDVFDGIGVELRSYIDISPKIYKMKKVVLFKDNLNQEYCRYEFSWNPNKLYREYIKKISE